VVWSKPNKPPQPPTALANNWVFPSHERRRHLAGEDGDFSGTLQTITTRKLAASGVLPLGERQAMVLLAPANSTGGVMGKMIDAQSIVVSAATTGQPGQEGVILRFVFWHSLALAVLMGLLVLGQAYVWTWMIPG
jgi:hypothetical protein